MTSFDLLVGTRPNRRRPISNENTAQDLWIYLFFCPPGGNAGRAYPTGAVPNPRQMLNNVLKTRHPMQQQQQQAFIAAPGVPAQAQQPQNVGWVRQRGGMARGARLNIDARAAAIFAQQPSQQPAGAPMGAQHFAAQPSQGRTRSLFGHWRSCVSSSDALSMSLYP